MRRTYHRRCAISIHKQTSSYWRIWIISVTIPCLDGSILLVDDKFTTLSLRQRTRESHSLCFRGSHTRSPASTFTFTLPTTARLRCNMYVILRHFFPPFYFFHLNRKLAYVTPPYHQQAILTQEIIQQNSLLSILFLLISLFILLFNVLCISHTYTIYQSLINTNCHIALHYLSYLVFLDTLF